MNQKTYEVRLGLNELLLLDGKVSENAQAVIDKAKSEASYGFEFPLIGELLRKAEESGKFTWKSKQIRACKYCDKSFDYARYPRNGRYHRKGDKNLDKPIYYSGLEFNPGFINFAGIGDICASCATKHNVLQTVIDFILDSNLKVEIQKNDYRNSEYIFDQQQQCFKCEETMYESEMRRRMTAMGDGTYPATCPHCGAESTFFGPSHKVAKGYRLIKGKPAFLSNQRAKPAHVPLRQEETVQ